jgi:pimeloyl-ACP methyl ester carboxylesterase
VCRWTGCGICAGTGKSGYDWRRLEDRLNGLPQFTTELDGLDVHFMHLRSPHPDALPLIVTHGWPGSVVEFLDVVEPLVDPVAHGGEARDAFDVVCPSLPGFGFSAKPARVGMPAEQWVGSAGWITGPGHIAPGLSE